MVLGFNYYQLTSKLLTISSTTSPRLSMTALLLTPYTTGLLAFLPALRAV